MGYILNGLCGGRVGTEDLWRILHDRYTRLFYMDYTAQRRTPWFVLVVPLRALANWASQLTLHSTLQLPIGE